MEHGDPGELEHGDPGELEHGDPGELGHGDPGELGHGDPGELEHGGARLCPPLGAGESKKAFLRRRPFFAEFRAGVRGKHVKKHKYQRPLEWLFGDFRL